MKFFFLLTLVLSCSKSDNSAEGRLKEFTRAAGRGQLSREMIEEFTTGSLNTDYANLSEEQLESVKSDVNVDNIKISVERENCDESQCSLTYIVKYKQAGSGESSTEVKKIAQLDKVEGRWKISSINNVNTYIELEKSIDVIK